MSNATHRGNPAASACDGKEQFDSAARAADVARQVSRRRETKAQAYKCPYCGAWHVGVHLTRRKP